MQELLLDVSNMGEPFLTLIISAILIFFAAKGKDRIFYILCAFSNLSRLAMVFLFTFFACDSAKAQLAKTDL